MSWLTILYIMKRILSLNLIKYEGAAVNVVQLFEKDLSFNAANYGVLNNER